jgi:hypothetical protein
MSRRRRANIESTHLFMIEKCSRCYGRCHCLSHYYLFAAMKNPLRGRRFLSLQGLASAISQWQFSTPGEWFAAGLSKLPQRWEKCVALNGGYIERLDID